jgi:hypothetical protein
MERQRIATGAALARPADPSSHCEIAKARRNMDGRTPLEVADVTDEFLDSLPLDGPFPLLDREALAHFKQYLQSQHKRRFQNAAVMPSWMLRELDVRLSKVQRMCDNAEEYYRSMAATPGGAGQTDTARASAVANPVISVTNSPNARVNVGNLSATAAGRDLNQPGLQEVQHEPPPEGIWQALFRAVWRLPHWCKWPIIILLALVLVVFTLCVALPDATKQKIIDWITKQF